MRIDTIILAGGKSSRMGQDKALLTVNKQQFISHIFTQANQLSERVYLVSPWVEKYQHLLPNTCQFVQENPAFQGPLSAFAQALPHTQQEWILLLACDLPYLNLEQIKTWLNYLPQLPPEAIAFLAPNQKGWECLCGFYQRQCLDSLRQYLQTGKKSFQGWLKNEIVMPIKIENKDIFFNCNTPEDYLRIQELYSGNSNN